MGDQAFSWEPALYTQFADFRDRPFFDLTARITATAPTAVVDLGCGPGHLTATLARRWPGAHVVGLDSSVHMIAAAKDLQDLDDAATPAAARPHRAHRGAGLSFAVADLAGWVPTAATEVIVSNAALHWVPEHRSLLAGWLAALRPGAWLAVQVPGNFGAPSHTIMRELAASARWRAQLDGVLRHEEVVAEPAEYQELFLRGGARVEVWETTYNHLLPGENPVLDWVRGTGLRPVLATLGPHEGFEFEQRYAALVRQAYPATEFGTNFEFRRIFMVGEKQ